MNKSSFFKKLKDELHERLPAEEERVLSYYSELYDEKYAKGVSADGIIAGFRPPAEIVNALAAEVTDTETTPAGPVKENTGTNADKNTVQKTKFQKAFPFLWNKTFWLVYFSAFIITFPVTAGLFAVAVGLAAGIFGLTAALFTVSVSLPLTGLYSVIHSLFQFGNGIYVVLAEIGMGFAAIGIGVLLFIGMIKVYSLTINAVKRGLSK